MLTTMITRLLLSLTVLCLSFSSLHAAPRHSRHWSPTSSPISPAHFRQADPVVIQSSQYANGTLGPYEYDLYSIEMPRNDVGGQRELRISMTSFSGDAEVFVTTDKAGKGPPSNMSYIWRGYDAGTSSLVINSSDPNWCLGCQYWIAAYSHEYFAIYSLIATVWGSHAYIEAYRNHPVNTLTPRGSWQGFFYKPRVFEQQHGIRITTTPSYGAAQVYVKLYTDAGLDYNTSFPTRTDFTWQSYGNFAGSYTIIPHDDPAYRMSCNASATAPDDYNGCVLLIAVYQQFDHPTQYTMLVTQNSLDSFNPDDPLQAQHIRLVNHVPFIRSVHQGEHEYYVTYQLERGSEFYVSLTRLSGSCSMVVSLDSQYEYPDESSPGVWSSEEAGTQSYSFLVSRPGGVLAAMVYVGVRAYTNCSYTIVSNVLPPSRLGRFPARLTDGVPQYDSLMDWGPETQDPAGLNSWHYYVFYLPGTDGITLSLSKHMGDVEVYAAGDYWSWRDNYTDFMPPNQTNYDVSLADHGLTSYTWNNVSAGRFVFGVHARYRADYIITVTAAYTDQVLLANQSTVGYLRPFEYMPGQWAGYSAQYVFVLDNILPMLPPLALSITELSGHVDIFVSDTYPGWYINGSDPSTYNWTQSYTRFETILINGTQLRRGPYWIKVYAWEPSTFTVTAGYANTIRLQVGLPQSNWMPPEVSHYYAVTVPGTFNQAGAHGHDLIATLIPLWGRCAMVYNYVDPSLPFVLPDHRNVSTFDIVNRGNYPGLVYHEMQISNYFCPEKRCTYLIEVYSYMGQDCRYNLQTFSFNTSDSNNQSAVIQHTVPQLTHIGEGWEFTQQSHYTFHVPLDYSTVTLALTRLGNIFNSELSVAVHRCYYPGRPDEGEWRTDLRRNGPVIRIEWDSPRFSNRTHIPCGPDRQTPYGQAGVYYVTIFNEGSEADFSLALSIRSLISRYTNESSVVLVNTLPQVGVAPWPQAEYFRMFQLVPGQQIHIALPEHSLLYHSITEAYPNRSNTLDFKDSRLDDEWVEWPLNATAHYFGIQSGEDVFYIVPKLYNGTNDTSVVSWLEWANMQEGRAYPGQVTHYQFYIAEEPEDFNLSYVDITMDITAGNPHLYMNYAPFNGPGLGTNITFPSRDNNMWNITDPNAPVLRIQFPQKGRYLLSIVPSNRSQAQAEWRLTVKRPYDFTMLHDGWQRSDWLWHNTSAYHMIHMPQRDDSWPYAELRISFTSWYGDAEIFVSNGPLTWPGYDNYNWRGYDAGTASLVINSTDPMFCYGCDYYIAVFSNEVASYYSIAATVYGNWSSIALTNHLPISHRTPVNGTQRFYYVPKNYELQHGFRIHLSPAYGAATFAINVIDRYAYAGLEWPYPNATNADSATWSSWGFFEGSMVHVSHLDAGFCSLRGNGSPDDRSRCIYLISVFEGTGQVDAAYSLLLQSSLVDPSLLPADDDSYDPIQEPHNRLLNHVPIQQYGEAGNITYYKSVTVNNATVFYFSLTVLSGWADVYASSSMRYPNSTVNEWSSLTSNTTAFSFITTDDFSFTEIFFAVETHINTSYTIVAGQYSFDRLGRFPLRLTNGVPQYDTLDIRRDDVDARSALHYWRYYVYYLPVDDDLLFSINKVVGEPQAYIAYDPLLDANNASYSQFSIPTMDTATYAQSMRHNGLDTIAWNRATAGRYVIGVFCDRICDYQISVTAHFTHQVLTRDLPMAGVLLPYLAGVDDWRSAARYVVYQPEMANRNLSIIMTTLSGLAHVFVSDTTWDIDPSNASTYRWNATTHPYQIDIPAADSRPGPYWIMVNAWQNTTYTMLATEFYWTGLQLGLPQTVGAQANASHVYAIAVPGGHEGQWLGVSVLPLYGRAWMYYSNITSGFSAANYPNHSDPGSYQWYSADLYNKPQLIWLDARQCSLRRCSYLFEVNCPLSDCFYTINAFPWSDEHWNPSRTTILIEQHVPQVGYLDWADDDYDGASMQHYEFHIPDDHSTAVLAFTRQYWGSDPQRFTNARLAISRFEFPTCTERECSEFPVFQLGEQPVIVIDWRDRVFNQSTAGSNRTQAGAYYVTLWNLDQDDGLSFTLSLTIRDDVYADNKGLILVDTVAQIGVNRPGDDPLNYYRLYKHSAEAITHIKMSGDLELFHNNGSGFPYPRWDNAPQDSLSSATALEWLEWPVTAGAHYFGVFSSDWYAPYYLLPYFADGANATNVRQWLEFGSTRIGRLPANHTIYFRIALYPDDDLSGWQSIELRLEPVSGSPLAWINRGDFNWNGRPGEPDTTTVFPSWLNYQWAINNTDVPFASISPLQPGEYLIAVHAYHDAEASFRITANLRGKDDRQTWTDLRSGEISTNFMANNSVDLYRIVVPEDRRRDPDHRIKISLTSWYGEAEFFVARGLEALNASRWQWRTYDAGTASVIIDDHDGDACREGVCMYFVAVYANEITAYYSLFATFGQDSLPWIQLTNHLPLNAALGPGSDPRNPDRRMGDLVLFSFTPKNYQLQHGLRIHTMPAYGAAQFAVNVISASNATAGWLWPMDRNASWQSGGLFSGSWLHIAPTDPDFCTSTLKSWTGPTGDSDCVYLIAVLASEYEYGDSQFTILVSTYTPEDELPRGLEPGSPAFNEREPHVRLLNNVPLALYQPNGTWNYFKAFTNQPWTETVVTLTCVSGWADFYVDDVQPFPNGTAGYNWFNSHDANVSTVQFIVYDQYSWDELFIGVRAWTNVTYTITLSQYPTERLGRFPMRLIDGVPQADTLSEYDMGAQRWLNSWRYYVFYQTEADQELRLSITRFMGEVEVYVLQQPFDWRRPYGQNWTQFDLPPFAYNHTLNDHGLDALTIPQIGPGRFVIAVHAARRADYTITVARRWTPMQLMKDVPTPGHIRPSVVHVPSMGSFNYSYQLYQMFVPDAYDRDLVIGVTVLSGRCNLLAFPLDSTGRFANTSGGPMFATEGVRLQQLVIPAAVVRAGQRDWIIGVLNNDNATFQILVSDYYFAQLQLGLPTNAWLKAGDSHVYGITVPGGEDAHDLLISATPILGRTPLSGTNITAGWKQPNTNVDFLPDDPYSTLDVLYINNYNCYAARCTYLVQVNCSTSYAAYCRYGLQAIPWTTQGVSNTSIVLQDTVPQLGFSGVYATDRNPYNISMTHYVFHVPNAHSNVSVQLTDLDNDNSVVALGVSRVQFPNTSSLTWQFAPSSYGADSTLLFDFTNALFTSGQLQQAGPYYMTVYSRLRPAAYLVTLNVVDDTNRHRNSSAIILLDGQRQAGYQSRSVYRTLYTFVSPQVDASRGQVAKAITIQLQRARPGPFNTTTPSLTLPDLFVTWDGSVPTPDHYVFSLTGADVTDSMVIYPNRPMSCDNTAQDCVYTIGAYKPGWFNDSRDLGTRYSILATAGNSFLELHDGEPVTNWAVVGAQANYTFYVGDDFDSTDNYDLTVTVTPLRLFCSAVAYISREGYPDVSNPNTPRTNYTQGVRTVHLRRAQSGLYVIAVYAYSDSDPYCQFTMSVTTGLVVLEDGNSFADYLPGLSAANRNESWRWYRFPQQPYFQGQVLTFQLDPLSPESRLNFYVKYDSPNHNEPWPWQSLWNATSAHNTGHVISIRPNSTRPFVVAVECVREKGDCAYELTAQAGLSHRVLQDGVQINAPQPLQVGEYAYYRAYAIPDSGYQTGLTIALGRIYGMISAYASFSERRPSNLTASHRVFLGEDNAGFIYLRNEDLTNGGNYSNRTGYVWISVRGEGPDMALYTISASLSATFLQQGEATVSWCYPGRDSLFIYNVDSLHPVLLEATSVFPREANLQLAIRDRNNQSDMATWSFESWGLNRSAYITPWDSRLQACLAFPQGCTLIFNISCQSETVFILYAIDPEAPIRMTDDDEQTLTLVTGNDTSLVRRSVARFEVGVSNPSRLDVYVESCSGDGVFAYMNFPSTPGYPSNSSYNQKQDFVDQLLRFDLGTELIQKDSFYRITVVPQYAGESRFRVVTNTIRDINFPTLASAGSFSAYPAENGATISFNPAVQGSIGPQMLYSLYYVEHALYNKAALYTYCGVTQPGVREVATWSYDQVQTLVPSGGRTASYTVGGLNPDITYRFGMLVRYQNWSNGAWTAYTPSNEVVPTKGGGGGDDSKVAEDAGAVILGVVLPITLILAGIALYLYIRNKRLQQELSVELPDVSATPSSASARRRAQRGPDVGGDGFSRGGGDMYNSLLGEEESAGDDKRRTGRAARKTQTSNGGSRGNNGDMPEDSDVAYRSDVI